MGIDNGMQFNNRQQQDLTQRCKVSNYVEAVDKIKDTYEQLPYHIIWVKLYSQKPAPGQEGTASGCTRGGSGWTPGEIP